MGNVIVVFSPHQASPLHFAVDKGHFNTVMCLLEKGADLHNKDGVGVSTCEYTTDCGLVQV